MTLIGCDPTAVTQDAALLRCYEPVLRMTRGELFWPVSVERYLADAALLTGSGSSFRQIAEPGSLHPARLAELCRRHAGEPLWLRYVQQLLTRRHYRAWARVGGRPPFTRTSSAAAVGLLPRILAALSRLSLLLHGKAPGGGIAAAVGQSGAAEDAGTCHHLGTDPDPRLNPVGAGLLPAVGGTPATRSAASARRRTPERPPRQLVLDILAHFAAVVLLLGAAGYLGVRIAFAALGRRNAARKEYR